MEALSFLGSHVLSSGNVPQSLKLNVYCSRNTEILLQWSELTLVYRMRVRLVCEAGTGKGEKKQGQERGQELK